MKLSQLLASYKVTSTGYPALAGLGAHSTGNAPVVLSSLPPAVLIDQGVTEYYTLVLPRHTDFKTTDEILAFNPVVSQYRIETVDTAGLPQAITTQHLDTLEVLAGLYPEAEILVQKLPDGSKRDLSAAEVAGKHVIGVLPPFLVAAAAAFTSASTLGYNAAVEKELSGEELRERLQIADKAITVKEVL